MREWQYILRLVRDNITLIVFLIVVAMFGVAWLVFEAIRSHQSRDEIFRLRQRLSDLERERQTGFEVSLHPVVLSPRKIRVGSAATTSDGGCLIYVENASAMQRRTVVTVRVDGELAWQSRALQIGQKLEIPGKSGTYILDLYGVEGAEAFVSIALRSKHAEE
jgi:hypothetical protein